MMLPPLTFMMDPTMNLMSGPHHECKRRESTILRTPGVPKNYSINRGEHQSFNIFNFS